MTVPEFEDLVSQGLIEEKFRQLGDRRHHREPC